MRTKLVTLLILLTCSFSFSSCDRDDYDEDYLEGIWWSVDDYYDVIRLNLNRNGMGTCEETYYDRYGYAIGSDLDYFEWNVINGRIHIYFLNGGRFYGDEWIWDYRIKNGHTVIINGRRFTREKSYYDDWWYDGYYSKKHQPDALAGAKESVNNAPTAQRGTTGTAGHPNGYPAVLHTCHSAIFH